MNKFCFLLFVIIAFGCRQKRMDRFVKIQGGEIHIRNFGKGSPTILFENGMGSKIETWKNIPDTIAKNHQVFLYNRAGIGDSELSNKERTIPNMVEELREILKKETIEPPYIFVAHSMGSYVARYFASEYPKEIQGVLLVDPSPDVLYNEYSQVEYDNFKAIGDNSFKNAGKGEWLEWQNYLDNRKYLQNRPISDDIPIFLLSATQWDFYQYHSKIMNKNTFSKHLRVEGSHDVHQEKPELIIELIQELIKM